MRDPRTIILRPLLNEKGEISITELQKGTQIERAKVDMALGWLAREGKIEINGNRYKKIKLAAAR